MSEFDTTVPTAFDPFAEANAEDSGAGSKDYVHIRVQQRNGRKSLTTVQGLKKDFSYNKILKDLKKEFCCNGTVVQDPELGQVIQLQGDQRKNVSTFLVQAGIVKKEFIKIHGRDCDGSIGGAASPAFPSVYVPTGGSANKVLGSEDGLLAPAVAQEGANLRSALISFKLRARHRLRGKLRKFIGFRRYLGPTINAKRSWSPEPLSSPILVHDLKMNPEMRPALFEKIKADDGGLTRAIDKEGL
ncbi:hypothetical protein QYF36_010533 [Acer negundo]|nr:hypothetical protein QYF36_010533 [Acer negundo]